MELQLGLALPTVLITTPIAIKGTLPDLNSEEQSDASTGVNGSSISTHRSHDREFKNKRCPADDEAFTDQSDTASIDHTLPLLLWNKAEDDDCPDSCSLTLIRNGEEETEGAVGWPPIKSCRKRQSAGAGGLYVKAQMEGVLITRKIDLSLHHSYHTLVSTLMFMFGKGQESVNGYTFTYQDMEGDWLLAAEVPWRIFIESVQRMKLLKNGD